MTVIGVVSLVSRLSEDSEWFFVTMPEHTRIAPMIKEIFRKLSYHRRPG